MSLPPFQTDPRTQKLPPELAMHPVGFDATGWHYAQGEKTFGPVDLRELQVVLSRISEPRNLLVWKAGFKEWERAGNVPQLAQFIDKPPPLPQTSQPRKKFSLWRAALLGALFMLVVRLIHTVAADNPDPYFPTKCSRDRRVYRVSTRRRYYLRDSCVHHKSETLQALLDRGSPASAVRTSPTISWPRLEKASASRLACPITQLPFLGIKPQAWECAPHV